MKIAIIPARGGSKRIPRKNIKEFCGKPMIYWSIRAAIDSGCFDEVVVSTDSNEISDIAKLCGASVPFLRPSHLSDDYTSTLPVLAHAVKQMETMRGILINQACCIYATAPFVTCSNLMHGEEILNSSRDIDFAFSVTTYPYPVQRALIIDSSSRVKMLYPENEEKRSQDLLETYHDAGQFYWFRRNAIFENDGVFSSNSAPVYITRDRVQDIDTEEDWACAELAFKLLGK